MPTDPDTGKRYPYTKEGRAAFERDQRKKKRGKKRKGKGKKRGRRPGRDPRAAEVLTGDESGLMQLVEEAKRRKE